MQDIMKIIKYLKDSDTNKQNGLVYYIKNNEVTYFDRIDV